MTAVPSDPDHRDRRRAVCKACIGGLTACSVGAVGFPVVSFFGFPRRLARIGPIELPLEGLSPGQAQYVDRSGQQIIVLSTPEGPAVLDAACTHLGCSVIWDTAEAVFRCPCHGAVFDATGEVVSGPVNEPLRKIPFEIRDDQLVVS